MLAGFAALDGMALRLPPGETVARAFGAPASGLTLVRVSLLEGIAHDLVREAHMAVM